MHHPWVPRTPQFKVKNTDKGWLLHIPASVSDTGKLQRRYFPTREKANNEATRLRGLFRSHGESASVLPPRVAGDAFAAWSLLEPRGKTLLEAARFLLEALDRESESCLVSEAIQAFVVAKSGQSVSQMKANRLMKDALVAFFPEKVMRSVTTGEILEFLDSRTSSPGSYNQAVRLVAAFWRWAAKPPRKWCDAGIVAHLDRRETVSQEIGVLTAKGAECLLRTAEKHYPASVPAYAISLFKGVRKQELKQLQPSDISSEGIEVPASVSKTKRRRFIQMDKTLAAWLEAYPIGETVVPPDWPRIDRAVRRLAGWRVWSSLSNPPHPPEDLPAWPHNAIRHTAASVALALGKPVEILVFEHGHSGGLKTLQQHYIGKMPKAEAKKIMALRPLVRSSG